MKNQVAPVAEVPRGKQDGQVVATPPWGRAEAVLGDMLQPVGLYPERYLVEDFPSDKQLAALGSR